MRLYRHQPDVPKHAGWLLGPVALLMSSLLLVGCASGESADERRAPSAASTSPAQTNSEASTPGTAPTSASPRPTTTTTSTPFRDPQGNLILEIYALQRREDIVVLDFGVRNAGSDVVGIDRLLGKDERSADVSGVYLHDVGEGYQYWPAEAAGECACSTDLDRFGIKPGHVRHLSATYGELPADIDRINLVVPHVGTIEDVRLS